MVYQLTTEHRGRKPRRSPEEGNYITCNMVVWFPFFIEYQPFLQTAKNSTTMEALFKALIWIQQNLQAPKSEYNSFGKYNYRSLESILAALKPLLAQQHCGIRFADDVVEHGGRTFVRSTLYFFNDKGESISTTAEAEHSATKTGMDSAQITGAASSYARKYCSRYNSRYKNYAGVGGDCANFVSQCVSEGGGLSLSGCSGRDSCGMLPAVSNLKTCLRSKGFQ